MSEPIRVAIIGCGNIAGPYAEDIATYKELELVGVVDIDPLRAQAFAEKHNTTAYDNAAAMLADDRVDIVINLTIHTAHKAITELCLNAGKHVYSEKPLAMTAAEARSLVQLADKKGLRLGCSPFTLMGEAQQTAWKLIREGALGVVRVVYAEVNWARIETWHPEPQAFYEVGPLFDVGVYPLTILVSMFGPAKRVQSYGTVLYPRRVTKTGAPFEITTPDFAVTMVELADGTVVRLTTNFYVGTHNKQTGLEFHGDKASLHLRQWQDFDSPVEVSEFNQRYEPVELLGEPARGTPWGRGVWEMARAMQDNRPHRFTGEMAAHVVEILEAASASMKDGHPVELASTFTPPPPMAWAEFDSVPDSASQA